MKPRNDDGVSVYGAFSLQPWQIQTGSAVDGLAVGKGTNCIQQVCYKSDASIVRRVGSTSSTRQMARYGDDIR